MEDVVTRASHVTLHLRFASLILSCNLVTLVSAPDDGYATKVLRRNANARKSVALSPVSLPLHYHLGGRRHSCDSTSGSLI